MTFGCGEVPQQHGDPHHAQVDDGVDAFVSRVQILRGSEALDVLFARLQDFEVLGQGCPVGEVESEIAVLVAPLRPNLHILPKSLEAQLSDPVLFFLGRVRFRMHEKRDAKLPSLNEGVDGGRQFSKDRQVWHDLRPWLPFGDHP